MNGGNDYFIISCLFVEEKKNQEHAVKLDFCSTPCIQ